MSQMFFMMSLKTMPIASATPGPNSFASSFQFSFRNAFMLNPEGKIERRELILLEGVNLGFIPWQACMKFRALAASNLSRFLQELETWVVCLTNILKLNFVHKLHKIKFKKANDH